jgi:hypothetical protein
MFVMLWGIETGAAPGLGPGPGPGLSILSSILIVGVLSILAFIFVFLIFLLIQLSIDCLKLWKHTVERRVNDSPAPSAIFRLLMTFVNEVLVVVDANDSPVFLEKIASEASALGGGMGGMCVGRTFWGRLLDAGACGTLVAL